MATKKTYTGADIEVLEGLEPVRKRPGMFVAGTDTPAGLHQLVDEILDNSVDEAMNGYADKIYVTLHKDGMSVTVTDNGRGIPVDMHPKFKKPTLEIVLTTLHAGGKFSGKNYQTSGGLHGVGSSVVNALSEELVATVKRAGKEYQQKFCRGAATSKLKVINKNVTGSGTTIFFRPDAEIFKVRKFSADHIRKVIQTKAYLNPGLALRFIDETAETKEEFCYPDGIKSYLMQILADDKDSIIGDEPFFIQRDNGLSVTITLAWTEKTKEECLSFANGIHTSDGGSHEIGVKSGIVRAVRNYMSVHDVQTKNLKITAEDIREGIVCVVSVKIPSSQFQTQFQGQTKSKLNNPEVTPIVENVARSLEQVLNEKPSAAQAIMARIMLAAKARAASREAGQTVRRKIGIAHRLTLPGKLADCSSNKPDHCELFIVEGDSAGGSAKQGRDRHFQAVLPLRGKVLNTMTSNTKKVADNRELANIVSALGCGVDDQLKVDKIRYGKVIILTDADADGMHIATLLMAFFFKHMRPVIEEGCLYIGNPPLYGIFPRGVTQSKAEGEKAPKGKKSKGQALWAYSDEEMTSTIKKEKLSNPRIVRFKGLGEMNPETLWETTLDPAARTLLRVNIDDEQVVMEELDALMGSDASKRYEMIQASGVMELDI
ncbi:MAG: type IIA DNA topoisomerase subunit B [Deltaproteobacteria bacterium]|nr:type IIA DNA topoisomerase subunit B [Deltaproteobacteria bacterium]